MNRVYVSKWWQTIKISWVKLSIYRLNFFLRIISPSLVFLFIKYNLWLSIYGEDKEALIGGFTFDQMIHYHIWNMVVSLLVSGHLSDNLSEDIRLGKISSYLIYPFNFWEFHSAGFIAFQCLQLVIAIISVTSFYFTGLLTLSSSSHLLIGVCYCLFTSVFWYCIQYLIGILAFWLEETWILRYSFSLIVQFLSGAIIPLTLFPEALVNILNYTPFPYLAFYPIKIFMGQTTDLGFAYTIIGLWLIILFFLTAIVWKKGIRRYEGAGM